MCEKWSHELVDQLWPAVEYEPVSIKAPRKRNGTPESKATRQRQCAPVDGIPDPT
jgi:hypothetical protein